MSATESVAEVGLEDQLLALPVYLFPERFQVGIERGMKRVFAYPESTPPEAEEPWELGAEFAVEGVAFLINVDTACHQSCNEEQIIDVHLELLKVWGNLLTRTIPQCLPLRNKGRLIY